MLSNYISAVDCPDAALKLRQAMSDYYRKNPKYYADIQFSQGNWHDAASFAYRDIIALARDKKVCELGCGAASILTVPGMRAENYSGCDFSADLMQRNAGKYPGACFRPILDPDTVPFESEAFDMVFSVFVLEHVVEPHKFLAECFRLCRSGGIIVILCPDYYAKGGITSQQLGFTVGTGSQKLKKGRVIDALLTSFQGRVYYPAILRWMLRGSRSRPRFLLNTQPVCFEHEFFPDADAVYVTCRDEIAGELQRMGVQELVNERDTQEYERAHKLIFYQGRRISAR